jgi:hypothetical protein
MTIEEAAAAARARADVSIDPADHALANALESIITARQWRRDRDRDPVGRTDDLPAWSAISGEDQ